MVRTASPTASSLRVHLQTSGDRWGMILHYTITKKCRTKVVNATPCEGFIVVNSLGISLYLDTLYMLYSVTVCKLLTGIFDV